MSPETLRIMCPNLVCRKILAVPKTARGKTVRCRSCGTSIRIPNPQASAGSAEDAGAAGSKSKTKKRSA